MQGNMRVRARLVRVAAVVGAAALMAVSVAATAQQFLYGHSANGGTSDHLYKIDKSTGNVVGTCIGGKGNGRGVVVVGNTVYYTVASSNNVYKIDFPTCTDQGVAFSVAGAGGLSTIAYDGTNFWIGDYSGTNKAYHYTPTGTLLATVTLANCGSFCDGLEFFQNKLISNRVDGCCNGTPVPYDVYDTSGNLLTSAFINAQFESTGIAFDGTNFYVSQINNQKIDIYNGTTGALINTLTLTGLDPSHNLLEDLSFDYSVVIPVAAPAVVPTLSERALVLMIGLLAVMAFVVLRRRRA